MSTATDPLPDHPDIRPWEPSSLWQDALKTERDHAQSNARWAWRKFKRTEMALDDAMRRIAELEAENRELRLAVLDVATTY